MHISDNNSLDGPNGSLESHNHNNNSKINISELKVSSDLHNGSSAEKSNKNGKIQLANCDFKLVQVGPKHSIQSNGSFSKENLLGRTSRFLKGILLTVLSGFFFSLTTLVVKYVKNVSPGTTAGFRYLGIIILAFPLALERPQPWFAASKAFLWIVLRGIAGGTSVFCRYSALQYMSMADSTIIILSMPVFVFAFARIFLKEPFGRFHVLALFMSIAGIMCASKIEFIFGKSDVDNSTNNDVIDNNSNYSTTPFPTLETTATTVQINLNHTDNPNYHQPMTNQLIGTFFSLGSTFVGCFVYIIIRKLKTVDKYVILFNFSIVSMIEMIFIDYFFFDFHLPQEGITPYLIVLVGILSFYAQLLLTRAIQIEEAGVVSVVRTSSEAFFAFFLQIMFFKQIPDVFSIVGAILVLSAVFLLSFKKYITGLPETDPLRKRFIYLTK